MKIIPTIEGFVYDDVIIMHTCRHDFVLAAKIKSQYFMLKSRLLHRIITHDILPKNRHYDEVTLIDMRLIDCMIRRKLINLST